MMTHLFFPSLLGFFALSMPLIAAPAGVVGPMVGHVTGETASLWMYAPLDSSVTVSWSPEDAESPAGGMALEWIPDPAAAGAGAPATAVLEGLSPDTAYQYEVKVNGVSDPAWKGRFKTATAAGKASAFRLAVTSCMKIDQPQASWFLLLAQQPDLHLTLGDTTYANSTDPAVQWRDQLQYRALPEFATVLRQIPTYSMWDDHDYGPNDSDGTAVGKEQSLRGWQQFWRNPGAGTAETAGAFYTFTRGEVQFFVVDGRYHRSPDKAPDDENKRMLGDAQFTWLIDGLKESKAKFKVIASGSTLQHSKTDGWRIYTFERYRLFDAIRENRIGGVIYTSGDIHSSQVVVNPESERVGYPLVEVISSGIANSETRSFATIDFDTTLADPSMRIRIIHGDGTLRNDKRWTLSQLQVN